MSRRWRWLLSTFAALVLLLAMAAWLLTIMLDESRTMSRGSPDTFILVPQVLRDLPEIEIEGAVTFHSSCGDGPKPMSEAVWYDSRANEAVVRREVLRHLESHGYRGDGGVLEGPEATIVISIDRVERGPAATHLEVWRYPSN